jgi:hypothetical protein
MPLCESLRTHGLPDIILMYQARSSAGRAIACALWQKMDVCAGDMPESRAWMSPISSLAIAAEVFMPDPR